MSVASRFEGKLILHILVITAVSLSPFLGQNQDHMANAQLQISNSEVSGRYQYRQVVDVTFPDGWTGFEASEQNDSTVVAAVSTDKPSNIDELIDSEPIMFLVISEKNSVEMAPGLTPPLLSAGNDSTAFDCQLQSSSFVIVNGVFSEESFSRCSPVSSSGSGGGTGDDPTTSKDVMLHAILTQTLNSWVALVLYETSESVGTYQADFESASQTLIVSAAIDFDIPFGFPTFNSYTVVANGTTVQLELRSSSNITQFKLDEVNKVISFRAEGLPSTNGVAELTVGRALDGPYVVTVNGDVWTDYDVLDDADPREARIQVRYEHDIGNIIIKGTQVVPEFSFGTTLGFAGVLPTIIVAMGLTSVMAVHRITERGKRSPTSDMND